MLGVGEDVRAPSDAVAEIAHFDGSLTRLDPGAAASVAEVDADRVVVRLGPGRSWHRAARCEYQAHVPSAIAVSRGAAFTADCDPSAACTFHSVDGTVIVRGAAGATVALGAGESVRVTANGQLEAVREAAHPLDHYSDVDVEAEAGTPPGHERRWRGGLVALGALALALLTLVVGRSGRPPSGAGRRTEPVALLAPPAVDSPAFAAARVAAAEHIDDLAPWPNRRAAAETDTAPSTTSPAPAPADYDVAARSCRRLSADEIRYVALLTNTGGSSGAFVAHVTFTDAAGHAVAAVDVRTAVLAPRESTTIEGDGRGPALRAATGCQVTGVDVSST
jgi:hypothetical protein